MDFFYDKQFRRYIQQFIRLFSNFEIEIDRETETYRTVPARYGDSSRMVSHILKQNSENVINSAPFISCWIQSLDLNPDARKSPYETHKVQVHEKKFNYATNTYDDEIGDSYQIEKHMPVPYDLTMQVDIWTSNTEQKFQLLEQILTLYNPSVNLISSSNPFDWTRLSYVELVGTQWTNRSVPTGVEDTIDITTLTFKSTIHLSVPSKVTKQTLIHTIISKIVTAKDSTEMTTFRSDGDIADAPKSYLATTFKDRAINVTGTTVTLLDQNGKESTDTWANLFKERSGALRTGVSQLKLMDSNIEANANFQVYGTLAAGSETNELTLTVDTSTLPTDTVTAPLAIINPQINFPGDGTLAAASNGQRYLILDTVPNITEWGTFTANVNDIIQYNGSNWTVSFDASATSDVKFTTNTQDSKKYKWNGSDWISAIEGNFFPGFWRVYL
ncbi:MAG: hypothetical protein CMQ75_03805 [Gammaproteobacteria bacterium]|nr:hypothetical protein [Gammaproteobacteria bacterium]|tara:strand:+ start:1008 stop:2339 length:1332 start_codon:yes stop_codon:yes gene_type:complete